jgi:hypothetical protein
MNQQSLRSFLLCYAILVILLMLILTGCSTTVPVARKFPDVPEILMQPAPELKPLPPDTTELSALISNANDNYAQYRILKDYHEAWQQWYREQKANWDTVK